MVRSVKGGPINIIKPQWEAHHEHTNCLFTHPGSAASWLPCGISPRKLVGALQQCREIGGAMMKATPDEASRIRERTWQQ